MAYNEALATRVREIESLVAGFSEKKLFGGLCFLLRGNMCCGVLKDELVLRLEPERCYSAFLSASMIASMPCRSR